MNYLLLIAAPVIVTAIIAFVRATAAPKTSRRADWFEREMERLGE